MCGFAGLINFNELRHDSSLEKKMNAALDRLHPRGPDQNGKWKDNNSYLVHARLSIIDVSENGRQPMEKYGRVMVYNGEIYNYKYLRSKLINYGYKFTSSSDSEVLIAGWDKWGDKVLNYINGMFSFAIWEPKIKKLTLARDAYGKKPLIYKKENNNILFASDIKSLEHLADNNKIDNTSVENLFKLRFIPDPLTIYKNVFKLLPGHLISFTENKTSLKKWYQLPNKENYEDNKEIISKNLIEYFDKAVKSRLISDVPLGVLLSGGLDSSLIIASLAESGKKLPCFTMGFSDASNYYEERKDAKRLAEHFGMDHHSFEISSKDILSSLPDIFRASDEPFADTSSIPFYMLSNKVSKSLKVVLSGDGGDEVFGGYRKYLGEKWSAFGLLIPKIIRDILIRMLIENKDTSIGELSRRTRRFLMNISKDATQRQAGWIEQISQETIKKLFGKNLAQTKDLLIEHRSLFKDPINSMLSADLKFSLPGDMLVKLDRMSMANSLEIRSPFLDRKLVEYAFNIKGNLKVGAFNGKKILRDTFKKRIPDWSLRLPKKGFEVPIANWLKGDLRHMVEDASSHRNLERMGIVNYSVVDDWKEGLFSGKRDFSWQLWTLISYKQWSDSRGFL